MIVVVLKKISVGSMGSDFSLFKELVNSCKARLEGIEWIRNGYIFVKEFNSP